MTPALPSPRARALVARFGRDTVAAQALDPAFQHWFADDAALVAFVDTGGAWVAAGSPMCARDRVREVADAFAEAARSANRRACFFAAEQDLGVRALPIGEQSVWDVERWGLALARRGSLRYQLNRARNHGVDIRPCEDRDRACLGEVIGAWQARHRMPPMHFLVELELRGRRVLVAEQRGEIVGFAALLDLPARDRVFVEHLVRVPGRAPNGTIELLVDAAVRLAGELGRTHVTLGLAPLTGAAIPAWLRTASRLGRPLYDFAGLRAFKAKLSPHAWEPVALHTRGSRIAAVYDALRAFAGGSLVAFGARTLWRRRPQWLSSSSSSAPAALPPG